jgi:hypothetical protein
LLAPNHRGRSAVGVDSIDVGSLCFEAVGHLLEDIRDLLVVQNWQPRFQDPIKPADRIGRNTACTLSEGRFLGRNQSWRYPRRIRTATTTNTTRSLTCLAAITAASLGTWSFGARAQPVDEGSVSSPSVQGEEDPAATLEPTGAASPSEVESVPEEPRTRTRRGEVFSDIYIGAAITTDAELTLDGVVQEESLLCGAECSSTKSPVGGLRVGWFVGRFPWLGVSGDFSVFVQSWGIQSAYEVTAIPISALLMFRAPLVRSPEHPNGRAQPYLAIGPSLVLSTGKLAVGSAALGTARVDSDTSVDPGLDARVGIRLVASSWISVILEYRATYFTPTWHIEGRAVATSVWTNHFIIGLGIHY